MILFITVLVLPMMLVFSGLAIDLAALGTLKDRVQVAADSAATAAASAYRWVKDDPGCLVNCPGQWVGTPSLIQQYVDLNGGFTITEQVLTPSIPKVRVVLNANISTSFLRLIGIQQLSTAAVAEAIRTNITQEIKDAEPPTPGRSALVQ